MKKALPFLAFCLKAVVIILIIYALVFVLMTYGLASPPPTIGEFSIYYGNFGKNPLWLFNHDYNEINRLYDQLDKSDPDSLIKTAVAMYEEALKKLALAKYYSFRCLGVVSFRAAGIEGDTLNTQIKSVERIGAPTLSANHPSISYYQNIVTPSNIKESVIKPAMESMITKGVREYSDGYDLSHEESSKNIFIDQNGGGAEWSNQFTTTTLEKANENGRQYYDDELREISNLFINEYTLLPGTVSIEKNTEIQEDGTEQAFYNIKFDLDCSDPLYRGSAVYYEAESIRKQVGEKLLKTLEYTEASLNLKIYESGYLTEWSMSDTWNAVFDAGIMQMQGGAAMEQKQTLSYHQDDCVIPDFTLKAA